MLDKEVYTDSMIQYFEENFINVKFDAETEFGYAKAFKYNVNLPNASIPHNQWRGVSGNGGFVPAPTQWLMLKMFRNLGKTKN